VKDGVVTLAGTPGSVILGRNVADQARHVEGVIAVRDRFTYPAAERPRSAAPATRCAVGHRTAIAGRYRLE